MTGRPDTTDPLDRAETLAWSAMNGYENYTGPWREDDAPKIADAAVRLARDVLALVAVAHAARGVMTQMDYETPHHTRLREALDRLDGAR